MENPSGSSELIVPRVFEQEDTQRGLDTSVLDSGIESDSKHNYSFERSSESPSPYQLKDTMPMSPASRGMDGVMPFDMDGSNYGAGASVIDTMVHVASSGSTFDTGAHSEMQQVSSAMRAKPEKVPCPRLCGAHFSPGVGGLVCFRNGEVQKMWNWFQWNQEKSSPSKSTPSTAEVKVRQYPRSLRDLHEMTEAAKNAQWGEGDSRDSLGEETESSLGDMLDDDNSDDGESIDSDAMDDFALAEAQLSNTLYDSYFGGMRRPLAVPSGLTRIVPGSGTSFGPEPDSASVDEVLSVPRNFDGPSYSLSSVVWITDEQSDLVFHGQCIELAEELKLGDWRDALSPEARTPETDAMDPQSKVVRNSK